MIVGVLKLELQLLSPSSLKEKRGIVRKILARIRSRFPVSAAEVDCHDKWQLAVIGVSMVTGSTTSFEQLYEKIEQDIEGTGLALVGRRLTDILHY